jgi:hypothetical protein
MYFLDPDRGRRRRRYLRDRSTHFGREAARVTGTTVRDLRNRAVGSIAELRSSLSHEEVSDEKLVARVRSKLGRATTHPRSIVVTAADGVATIEGDVLASEAPAVREAVQDVHGVRAVEDRLELHETTDWLQAHRDGQAENHTGANWKTAARILAGVAGGALLVQGLRRKGLAGAATGALGLGAVAQSILARNNKADTPAA